MEAQVNPWKKSTPQEWDNDIPTENHDKNMDNFENMEHENHTTLKPLTQEFDNLQQRVASAEGHPTEARNHLEHELLRLSLAFCPSVPPEPLDEVLQQYTEALCTSQKQTTLQIHLFRIYPPFSGSDSTQLEDWLVDIETAANLTDASRD